MERWEYKTLKMKIGTFWGGVKVDESEFETVLNQAGEQGWELVSSVDTSQYQGQSKDLICIMKRRKS
ncbi:DUF4177 domain-containing protein [Cohnella sp. WQ 127256]|uniref:DUF4177 domain-containing protein n=1 Tax=Cohnella sp. WQ 127256 TaxID=2938790 RepID=UPI002117FC92|nr:DUF4177 domain-containing protein [Cohnella sp. WQ 127256]